VPGSIPAYIIEPTGTTMTEIESRAELDRFLARGSIAGTIVQGLRLDVDPPDFTGIDVTGTLFFGCRFATIDVRFGLVRRGAEIVPDFAHLPYPVGPNALYTPDALADGFADGGFAGMYDTAIYRHYVAHGGALPDVREALGQRLHDAGIDDALVDLTTAWLDKHGTDSIVGIMGGHAELRGSPAYRLAATLGRELTRAGKVIVTGGGPGVMEAANLGSYMSMRTPEELTAAIDALTIAPDFQQQDPYTRTALEVRATFPAQGAWSECGGLSIPTWLYGHEPANLFAGAIAKYFSNAIREDTILRLARGGIVFAAGRAGTVQEVFQAATKTFYASDGGSGPYVFLDSAFWGALPAPDLLRTLLATTPSGDLSGLVHVVDEVADAVALLTS
jgi:predicted Rossmann-fold nucleotide-binding protein